MIANSYSPKHLSLIPIGILLVLTTGLSACTKQGPSVPSQPHSTPVVTETPEKQQLQQLYNLTHSIEYSSAQTELSQVEGDSSQLATFIEGLPKLPNLLQYVTIADIQKAVSLAKQIQSTLSQLPPLSQIWPPFPPPPSTLQTLDDARQDILSVTEPIEQLPDLPSFIQNTGSLEDAKNRIDNHLLEVKTVTADIVSILQRLKDLSEKPDVRLAEFRSLCSSSDYQTLATRISQINDANSELVTLVKNLPALPPLISNIPVNRIEDAVNIAKKVDYVLRPLPPLPEPPPPGVPDLEALRQSVLMLTGIVAQLPGLPDFISGSKNLEDVRVRTQNYLGEVQDATSHASAIMQQVNQIMGR